MSPQGSLNYANPILWEDLPDMEVIRVNDIYYMSASSFHFSPGAPILKSHNLVDWEYVGHSVPDLAAFGSQFRLDGRNSVGYVKGVWASTVKYRKSNGLFYWYGAIQGTDQTFIYTAKDPGDLWTAHPPIDSFYYDAGLLIDEDDAFYIAYGTKTIHVAQLSADGLTEVKSEAVHESEEYLEGARMYNIDGTYYIWLTKPWGGQYVLKSDKGPFGPYDWRIVHDNMRSPIAGSGPPHQGGLVDTKNGDWYYMAFIDAFPAGRIPVLAPIEFDNEGWPEIVADYANPPGQWRLEYPSLTGHDHTEKPKTCIRKHSFDQESLDHCWEWNQSPGNPKWSIKNGQLVLGTATVADNLYLAANTLTHRTIGPSSTATFCVNWSQLKDGDRAGVSMFRDQSAYIGIHRNAQVGTLVYVEDIRLTPPENHVGWMNGRPVSRDWEVTSKGTVKAEMPLDSTQYERLWLRVKVNVAAACVEEYEKEPRQATFEYSYDGSTFKQLGPLFTLTNSPTGWIGYRFGVFNFATKALGGQLAVEYCEITRFDSSSG
ncbi:hypothetical protein NM208_g1513 [Fusarium decemcellulare]|uniref:Uncharacterized protein n=1 Tax=Fusarium decemcellulare TaxID=57161 RepID=A0ACC1SVW5_9HYPO|nr:hypothetical protein NM208_g1513 [Fusarium decemcellulare]